MSTQQQLALPRGVVALSDDELLHTSGGLPPFTALVGGALVVGGVIVAVAVGAAVIGGVVYALSH